ncbi:MAG: cyclic nucleotide-binding domain-containing protein [Mariprofundales bacterium]
MKNLSNSELRKQARKVMLANKNADALECYIEMFRRDPKDLRIHVKVAGLREKTKDIRGAVRDYISIANAYAEDGFVVQAISINKIILRLDPKQTQVRERLKELSTERGDDWAISTISAMDSVQSVSTRNRQQAKVSFQRTPLLSSLSGDELGEFMDSLQLEHLNAKATIYREGDVGDFLYLIGMGNVILLAKDVRTGAFKAFSKLLEGDFFGEYAFMSRSKHKESAIAETDCDLLKIDRIIFDAWVNKYPNIRSVIEDFYRKRVLARILAITPVFEGVPHAARMELAQQFNLKRFLKGQVVIREGDAGDTFYLIRSGNVEIFATNMRNKEHTVTLGTMSEGNFFGEVALLTAKPRTATVVANSPVLELMELTRKDFTNLVKQHPSVLKIVQKYQKQRVQEAIRTMMK